MEPLQSEEELPESFEFEYSYCLSLFDQLKPEWLDQPTTLHPNWDDERGRLQLFAGQTFPRLMEDDKLRRASHVLTEITDLLGDLRKTLRRCELFISLWCYCITLAANHLVALHLCGILSSAAPPQSLLRCRTCYARLLPPFIIRGIITIFHCNIVEASISCQAL